MNQDFIIFSLPNEKDFYLLSNKKYGNKKIEFVTFDSLQSVIFKNNIIHKISLDDFFFLN